MAFLNVTFTGNIYDASGGMYPGNEVKYQLYFYKVNDGSHSSIWSSTRLSEYGQYNINLGDSDILTPEGMSNVGDKVLIAFWTPNTSIKSDGDLLEWGYIETELIDTPYYIQDVQLKGPMVPVCDFEVEGAITVNTDVVATDVASHNRHSWTYGSVTIYQDPTKYSQPIFYTMNTLPSSGVDITWGDSSSSNDLDPAQSYFHQYTTPGHYDITTYVTNVSSLSASQLFLITIYYNTPVANFSIDNDAPNPVGTTGQGELVTFTNTTSDPDSRAVIDGWTCDWTIEDGVNTATYVGVPITYNPSHQFHSPGVHTITMLLHWYNGHSWEETEIVKEINQQAWVVGNGLTWITPVYVNVESSYTPAITGNTSYISKVNYDIDDGMYYYMNVSYVQGFYYTFSFSNTHPIKQDIYFHNGFESVIQSHTFYVTMSPVCNFTVSDDVCGDLYSDDSHAGLPPITMYRWKVFLNNREVASLEGVDRNTFEYNWPTIGQYKVWHQVTDLAGQTAAVLKTYNINSCKTGGGSAPTGGGFAGGGVVIREKPLPKINVILKKQINKHIKVDVQLHGGLKMISLKSDEEKTLLFDVIVEGIEKNLLSFSFRLVVDGIEYGFPGTVDGDKIRVSIPAMENILKEGTMGIFKGKLEGVGDQKYYMKPWEDDVEIKIEPKVIAQVESKENIIKENVKVRAFLSSATPIVEEEKKPKKTAGKTNPALRSKLV